MPLSEKTALITIDDGHYSVYEYIYPIMKKYGIKGNLIKAKTAWLLMNDENPFSLATERNEGEGSVYELAKKDISEIRKLFFENFIPIIVINRINKCSPVTQVAKTHAATVNHMAMHVQKHYKTVRKLIGYS